MENQGNRKSPWEKMTGSSRRKEKQMEVTKKNVEAVNEIIEILADKGFSVREANEILCEANRRISFTSKVDCSNKLLFD